MSLRGTLADDTQEPKDETYKKIRSKKNIPEIPAGADAGGRFYFRLTRGAEADFHHFMQFWLTLGKDNTGKPIQLPRISANPFADFFYKSKGGAVLLGRSAADKGCILSKLADARSPLISPNTLRPDTKNGGFKPNVNPVHAAFIQVIEPKRTKDGKVVVTNGVPEFDIQAEELIFEFWNALWEQFVNIIEPAPAAAGADDGFTAKAASEAPKLPTTDLTKIVWMVWKKKRTENKTGDPKKDVDYVISFSEKVVLKDAQVPKPEPVFPDIRKAYTAASEEEVNKWLERLKNVSGGAPGASSSPDNPEAYAARSTGVGEAVPVAAGAQKDPF